MSDQISFPPLHDLSPSELAVRKQHLLSEIARQAQRSRFTLPTVSLFVRWRSWRGTLVVAVAVAALAGVGVAIADGFGAFTGLSETEHPQSGADVLDPETAAYLQDTNCVAGGPHPTCGPTVPGLLLDSTRRVGQLPTGQNVYVIATTSGLLCAVLQGRYPPMSCGRALSHSDPTTAQSIGLPSPADPSTRQPTFFGVAIDGVTAVSLSTPGGEVTVPVKDNVWTYQGASDALDSVTVHYRDGTSVTADPSAR